MDDWLDVEIERPQGADVVGTTDEITGEKDAEDDLAVEPRTVTITGHGARWSS
jgi:hypothetical protein